MLDQDFLGVDQLLNTCRLSRADFSTQNEIFFFLSFFRAGGKLEIRLSLSVLSIIHLNRKFFSFNVELTVRWGEENNSSLPAVVQE